MTEVQPDQHRAGITGGWATIVKHLIWISVVVLLIAYLGWYWVWRSERVMSSMEYIELPGPNVMYISVNEEEAFATKIFRPMVWLDIKITGVEPVSE